MLPPLTRRIAAAVLREDVKRIVSASRYWRVGGPLLQAVSVPWFSVVAGKGFVCSSSKVLKDPPLSLQFLEKKRKSTGGKF